MVALNADVALFGAAVVRPARELARRDLCLPVRAPELVLEQLLAVEPVLDVRAAQDDACQCSTQRQA